MRDELMPTFIKFQNNIIYLNEETQDYYFYYAGLYEQKESNDISYLLFNNKIKYVNMIDENNKYEDSFKAVDEKIINKLNEFKQYQQSKEILINNYNLVDILLFLKDILYEENSINNLLEILSICPFKYFVIVFKDGLFKVKPLFPYIEFFISEYIKKSDCAEYFRKEKYKNISFLTNRVKGEYFEYAAKISLKHKLQKKYQINKEIYVDKIAEMNEITTPFKYFLSNLKEKYFNANNEVKLVEEDNYNNEESIEIDLDKEINEEEIKKRVKQNFENDFKDFNIFEKKSLFNEKDNIINEINSFGKNKDYIFQFLLKGIDDYRIQKFEDNVDKRCEEIIKYINLAGKKNKRKRKIKIPIKKKLKKQEKDKDKEKYNGNENLLIDQTNSSGQIVDYAFLFGNKDDKKLLLFQMKCYSSDTNLEDIFLNKTSIKYGLSALLINSIKLFNCKIKEWHYILVFYYNDKDNLINNVGLKTLFSCSNKEIEYILFNPVSDKYYMREKNIKIIEKKDFDLITIESNLDQFSFTNMLNIINIDKFNKNIFNNNSKEEYLKGLSKFHEDFQKININFDVLQKELDVKNIKYFCHFKIEDNIISPRDGYIFLYKKKNSNYFIGLKNISNEIICFDLESKKKIKQYFDLIDYDYNFVYVLYFYDKITSKRTYNQAHYGDKYIIFKIHKQPKLSNQQ